MRCFKRGKVSVLNWVYVIHWIIRIENISSYFVIISFYCGNHQFLPSTLTLLPTPPLLQTPVHKSTSQYLPSRSSTSPSNPSSMHPPHPSPYPCQPRSHPHPSFPILCSISSGWDLWGVHYHPHNINKRRSPSYGTSEGTAHSR